MVLGPSHALNRRYPVTLGRQVHGIIRNTMRWLMIGVRLGRNYARACTEASPADADDG